MKIQQFTRTLMLLVMLLAGFVSSWAWDNDKPFTDDGGETCTFRWKNGSFTYYWGSSDDHHPSAENIRGFRTKVSLNNANNTYYWEWHFRVIPQDVVNDPGGKMKKSKYPEALDDEKEAHYYTRKGSVTGSFWFILKNGNKVKFYDFHKNMWDDKFYITNKNADMGDVSTVGVTNPGGWVEMKYVPKGDWAGKISKVLIHVDNYHLSEGRDLGPFEYEKTVGNGYTAMPQPTIALDDASHHVFSVKNIKYSQEYCKDQVYYTTYEYYSKNGKSSLPYGYTLTKNSTSFSRADNAQYPHYTSLIIANTNAVQTFLNPITGGYSTMVDHLDEIVIKPYTYPYDVDMQYNQWEKRAFISWRAADKLTYRRNNKDEEVAYDKTGRWYVIRYEKNVADKYTVVADLDYNDKLEVTDDDLTYDKDLVYRVIFLPDLLKEKYKSNLRKMQISSLYVENGLKTILDAPITLTQDRSDSTGIHLNWEYSITKATDDWTIQRRPQNGTTWENIGTVPFDANQSNATFTQKGGSTCDFWLYRVTTKVNDYPIYSDEIVCNTPAQSYISSVKASLGTEEKNVIVKWKVKNPSTDDIYYRILRRIIGEEEWTVLDDETHGTASEYTYIDDRVTAGSYYEYTVEAYGAKCDEQLIKTDHKIAPGFAQARATITGHLDFDSGTAVVGAKVNLVKSSADEETDTPQFLSRYIDGMGRGLEWNADSTKYSSLINSDKEMTIQFWVKPNKTQSTYARKLMVLNGAIEIDVIKAGDRELLNVLDISKGTPFTKVNYKNYAFDDHDFTHITAVYKEKNWTFYIGTDTLKSITKEFPNDWNSCEDQSKPTLSFGPNLGGLRENFAGYVDDIRVWTRALTEKEIQNNYTRILGGTEKDLVLYWPLDEGINVKKYAFDVARQDGLLMENHPEVGINTTTSDNIPSLLGLYGLTDTDGDYIIRGIPFQQGGTNYKVVPELGIHEFSPAVRSMFISPTSLTANNIDFEDVSSFPMRGYVYYAGTNIPAEGIQMYVDGDVLSKDGEIQTTDANGYYEISVPIGEHYVEAKLTGHTMVSKGRFPTQGTFNFNREMTYNFADSTLVNFVGRVGGGERNDTLAVGFGASKNNIGIATVKLKLTNDSFSFNCADDYISDAKTNRSFESDTTAINSHTWTGVGTESKYIYIETDSLTGEFSAMLPPLKYVTTEIKLNNNPNIDFFSLPEIDLTSVKMERRDSLDVVNEDGDTINCYYSYNTKMVKTYYAKPELVITQTGNPAGIFGEEALKDYSISQDEKVDIDDIWTLDNEGNVKYRFKYPIFKESTEYEFNIRGYEAYINKDSNPAVVDTIPLTRQVLTISNEMSNAQSVVASVDPNADKDDYQVGDVINLKTNQIMLDENGCNSWKWTTGFPNIVAPFSRQMLISYERNDRTYGWNELNGVVLGSFSTGTNFVTSGPTVPLMVLRDPPGAKSKTTWNRGEITFKLKNRSTGNSTHAGGLVNIGWGTSLDLSSGFGVALISTVQLTSELDNSLTYSHQRMFSSEEKWTLETTTGISTSDQYPFVGSAGDVFIGMSTNSVLGTCRKVGIWREGNDYVLDYKDGMELTLADSTMFMFSTYEIENTMIPKWKDVRNSLLTYLPTEDECNAYVNTSSTNKYLSWKKPSEEGYGEEGNYVCKYGVNTNNDNKVLYYNEQIRNWKSVLRQNEEDKVKAIKDRDHQHLKNISFDGGSSYTYSEKRDTSYVNSSSYSGSVALSVQYKTHMKASSGASVSADWGFDVGTGIDWDNSGSDWGENKENYAEFIYEFNDGNRGTDFSVDIYKSPQGWSDSFSLLGGQSYNPWEPEEKTKYMDEETVISAGTQRMEQPYIQISKDGENAAKSAIVTDVPAGQTGQVTLFLSNMDNTNWGWAFDYDLIVDEKSINDGLEVRMDGVPVTKRDIYIPAGETIKKILTFKQTDQSKLDHEGIKLYFCSQYQSVDIRDSVTLDVHFTPSSSPVELVVNDPVLNTETGSKLNLKVTNFNRQFSNLKELGVEYKFEGSTQWVNLKKWVTEKKSDTDVLLPSTGDLRIEADMTSNVSYPEGKYTFRAYTTTPYGNEDQHAYSQEFTIVKDMTRPTNLTTPLPSNGILHYGDDISIELNEDIVPGYVDDKNIIVTAKLNDQPVNHDVALRLDPYGNAAHTVNPIFLNGNFSVDYWLKWTQPGTILRQGKGDNSFSLTLDETGHLVVNVAGKQYVSNKTLPADKWTYMAMSFNASTMSFSALGQYDTETLMLFNDQKVDASAKQQYHYADDNYLYIDCGDLEGAMHDLALFNIYRDVHDAAASKYQSKNNYMVGLTNYWPMNEGHGNVAADARHTHDFTTRDMWMLDNVNYALRLDSKEGVEADISTINTGANDSYAIELSALPVSGRGEIVLDDEAVLFETGSIENNKIRLYFDTDHNLVLDYGKKSKVVANSDDFDGMGSVHHYALNVVRGQSASFYYDGKRTAVINEREMPMVEGATMRIGKGYAGYLDEIRYWRATLTEDRLLSNQWNAIDTTDIYSRGLALYLPFEKTGTVYGVTTKVPTYENMAPAAKDTLQCGSTLASIELDNGNIKNAPEETRLIATAVASERKVVIHLDPNQNPRAIEGTTLNITVDKLHDLHGNESLPIRWQAYVQQNTLKWAKDSVNIDKKYENAYTFDVDINNASGSTEYYTISNMPQWLSLVNSESTDDVAPLSKKTLRFRVDPIAAVGNYDVTIGMTGNNEITEPLRIVMKVRGDMPAWAVDPSKYENTMNVVGQIYIDGILMSNSESRLAAFIGDECRGIAGPEQVRGAAYVAMTIYGNAQRNENDKMVDEDRNQPVTFRIWDASTGVAYSNVEVSIPGSDDAENSQVMFDPINSYGNYDRPLIFTKTNEVEQGIKLSSGWNWISLSVEPEDSAYVVFKDIASWSTTIKDRYEALYSNGYSWAGPLKTVHANTMYKVLLKQLKNSKTLPTPLSVFGQQVNLAETPVTLKSGWNWIAYLPTSAMTLDKALAAANPQEGDQIKSQTAFAYYGPYGWEGNLKTLENGKGYLYFSGDTDTKEFIYPTASANAAQAPLRAQAVNETPSVFQPVDPTNYPDNMSMVIKVVKGDEIITDVELGVFIADECRAAAKATDGLYYLLISGEGSGQTMQIRGSIDGNIETLDESLTFSSDANVGTPWEPYIIDLNTLTGIYDINATQEQGIWYNLQGIRIGEKRPATPGVYIYNGRKVVITK